jgi:HEPN domain-containing protein
MPHDPARISDTKAWLEKADKDCKVAAFELTAEPPFTADAVYHAQQAVEKALKGHLAWHDVPFRKSHDLSELGQQCVEIDSTLEPLLTRAARLTAYAWKFRYPGDSEEPTREEAEKALALAREVVDAVLLRLPPEAHP